MEFEDSKLNVLLEKINESEYTKAITNFLKEYPEYRYRFDKKEGNVAFRCINKNNKNQQQNQHQNQQQNQQQRKH